MLKLAMTNTYELVIQEGADEWSKYHSSSLCEMPETFHTLNEELQLTVFLSLLDADLEGNEGIEEKWVILMILSDGGRDFITLKDEAANDLNSLNNTMNRMIEELAQKKGYEL